MRYILLFSIISFFIGVLLSFSIWHTPNKITSSNNNVSSKSLLLERTAVNISSNITSDEEKKIEDFVYGFEAERKLQNADKIMSYFTPPTSAEDKSNFDFIMGKDLSPNKTTDSPRLFTTQGFFNWVGASAIKSVNKNEGTIIVKVDELRISYASMVEPPSKPGYSTNILPVTIELKVTPQGFKIDKYYRDSSILKYGALSS